MTVALEPPRWPGGPPICPDFNLPYFATPQDMKAFRASLCTDSIVDWKCPACGGWHFWDKPKPPAGSSSGTGRAYRMPQRMRSKILAAMKETL